MDSITTNTNTLNDPFHSGAKTIQFGRYTFLNLTDQLKVVPPEEAAKNTPTCNNFDMVTFDSQSSQSSQRLKDMLKNEYYSEFGLKSHPVAAKVKLAIDAEMSTAVSDYYDGKLTEDELAQTFQTLSEKLLSSYEDLGYPNGLFIMNQTGREAALEMFYDDFRFKLLSVAVQRNNQEGRQYVTGGMKEGREYKYYNADYYYKSDAAIAALDKGVAATVEKQGFTDFTIPDYKTKGLNCYYNFNSAFSNNFCLSEQYLLDYDQVPPEGFKWFYESGGTKTERGVGIVGEWSVYAPDGTLISSPEPAKPKPFDPTDLLTARTWVSYRDTNGKEHRVSTDINYQYTDADRFNLSSLLKFSGGDPKLDAAANRFLSSLQVFRKNFFLGQTTKMFA